MSDVEEQFKKWLLNDFNNSIFRQYYGMKLGENHHYPITDFNDEFVSFFDEIYLYEPDEVISTLQAQENLGLKALTNGPKVNEAIGVNHFSFLSPMQIISMTFSAKVSSLK